MFIPPVRGKKDPRILGTGTSKMVWQIRSSDDFAVINAYDDQRFAFLPEGLTLEEKIVQSNKKIMQEFHFTQYVREIFGDLIPKVYLFRVGMFQDNKFRYAKELCEPVVKNDALFYDMIRIAEDLLDQGWVYLDMKPANLGIRKGKTCIVDTDPTSFYRFPPELKPYFVLCSYMIILLISRNHAPYISERTLLKFILDRQISFSEFEEVYRIDPPLKKIAEYGNQFFDLQLKVMKPRDFFDAYGTYGGKGPLYVLKQLIDLTIENPVPMPVTPDVLPPTTPYATPETPYVTPIQSPKPLTPLPYRNKYPRNPKMLPVLSPVMSEVSDRSPSPEKPVPRRSIFHYFLKRMPKFTFTGKGTKVKGSKRRKKTSKKK
jgi:hypothetical protein